MTNRSIQQVIGKQAGTDMAKTKKKTSKQSTTTGRKSVKFQVREKPGTNIYVSGSFNNWDGEAKQMKDIDDNGEYYVSLLLSPGKHEYKFVVNGEWHIDTSCPLWVINEYGTLNSVVEV